MIPDFFGGLISGFLIGVSFYFLGKAHAYRDCSEDLKTLLNKMRDEK